MTGEQSIGPQGIKLNVALMERVTERAAEERLPAEQFAEAVRQALRVDATPTPATIRTKAAVAGGRLVDEEADRIIREVTLQIDDAVHSHHADHVELTVDDPEGSGGGGESPNDPTDDEHRR